MPPEKQFKDLINHNYYIFQFICVNNHLQLVVVINGGFLFFMCARRAKLEFYELLQVRIVSLTDLAKKGQIEM